MIRKEQQTRIVALAYGERWPLGAIAAHMGLSYGAVHRVVVRAATIFGHASDAVHKEGLASPAAPSRRPARRAMEVHRDQQGP